MASNPSRRHFLTVLAASAVASAFDAGCSAPSNGVGPQSIGSALDAGNVSSLPVDSLRPVGSNPVAIGRDAGGVYAMTLTCTHAGCNIGTYGSVSYSGLMCGCHGSRFDRNGNVTQGPATQPLVHFKVTIDSTGKISIHGNQQVSESTRTPVA